jgi:hypothetical protein
MYLEKTLESPNLVLACWKAAIVEAEADLPLMQARTEYPYSQHIRN